MKWKLSEGERRNDSRLGLPVNSHSPLLSKLLCRGLRSSVRDIWAESRVLNTKERRRVKVFKKWLSNSVIKGTARVCGLEY